MISPYPPICVSCIRLHRSEALGDGARCQAFPDGIPQPILDNEADHHDPYPGDNGIHFESADGKDHPLPKGPAAPDQEATA